MSNDDDTVHSPTFELGELVLARSKSLPYWPAHVRTCDADGDEHRGKWRIQLSDGRISRLWCVFVNSPNSDAWLSVKLVRKYSQQDADKSLDVCRTPNQKERLKIAISTATGGDEKSKSDVTRVECPKDAETGDIHPDGATLSKPSEGATNPPDSNNAVGVSPNDVEMTSSAPQNAQDVPQEGATASAVVAAAESVFGATKANRPQRRRKKAKVLEDFESLSEDDDFMEDSSSDEDDDYGGVEPADGARTDGQESTNWPSGSAHPEDSMAVQDTPPVPGSLVLAKTGSYPFWPARVMRCESDRVKWNNQWVLFSKKKPARIWCSFIGDVTGGWVFLDKIRPYQPHAAEQFMSKPKSRLYNDHKNAIKLANEMHATRKQLKIYPILPSRSPAGTDAEHADPQQTADDAVNPQQSGNAAQGASPPTFRRSDKEPKYGLGHIVLAKYDASCPYWPAVIAVCKEFNEEEGEDETQVGQWHREAEGSTLERFCCLFINDGSEAWVPIEVIKPFTVSRAKKFLCSRNNELYGPQREAIAEAASLQKQKKANARRAVDGHWSEGDVVLARFEHCPFWPARVQKCEISRDEHHGEWKVSRGNNESLYWCSFLLHETCNWVPHGEIKPFTAARARHYLVDKSTELYNMQKEAIQLACQISDGKIFGDQVLDTTSTVGGVTSNEGANDSRNSDGVQNETVPVNGDGATEASQQSQEPVPSTPATTCAEEYNLSDVVLGKWTETAFWPAQVIPCPSDTEGRWKMEATADEPEKFWCKFVNHGAERWVENADLKPFTPHRARRFMVTKTSRQLQQHREAVKIASVMHKQRLENPDRSVTEADCLPLVKSRESVKKGAAKDKADDNASTQKQSTEAPATKSNSPRAVTSNDETKKKLLEKVMSEKAVACKALENRRASRKRKPRNGAEMDSDAADRRQELMKFDVAKYSSQTQADNVARTDAPAGNGTTDTTASPSKKDVKDKLDQSGVAVRIPKDGEKGAKDSSVGSKRMRVEVVEASGNAKKRK